MRKQTVDREPYREEAEEEEWNRVGKARERSFDTRPSRNRKRGERRRRSTSQPSRPQSPGGVGYPPIRLR